MKVAVTMLQCWHRTPGGTARAAIEQVRAMREVDPSVELVGVGPWGFRRWGRDAPDAWTPPVPVRHLPGPHQLIYETWHRVRVPPVQWATGPVDVVHATTITVPPRRRSTPLVVTVHDLFPLDHPDQFTERGLSMMRRGIDLARAEADVVLCSSESTLERCLADGFAADRLRHVPLGVDPTRADPARVEEVRQRHGLDGPFALWIGTIEPRKNLATLLAAFARVPPAAGRLVLGGATGWHVDLEALIEPIRDRVTVLGFVDDADLASLNAAATVAALPSHAEGFGLTALEAMVQGTPVIVSSGSASEEVVGEAGVVLPATDVDAWAGALERLLSDPDEAAALGVQGRERAARYSWTRCADTTLAAYRSVLPA